MADLQLCRSHPGLFRTYRRNCKDKHARIFECRHRCLCENIEGVARCARSRHKKWAGRIAVRTSPTLRNATTTDIPHGNQAYSGEVHAISAASDAEGDRVSCRPLGRIVKPGTRGIMVTAQWKSESGIARPSRRGCREKPAINGCPRIPLGQVAADGSE